MPIPANTKSAKKIRNLKMNLARRVWVVMIVDKMQLRTIRNNI